jgi:hypothetical protein
LNPSTNNAKKSCGKLRFGISLKERNNNRQGIIYCGEEKWYHIGAYSGKQSGLSRSNVFPNNDEVTYELLKMRVNSPAG